MDARNSIRPLAIRWRWLVEGAPPAAVAAAVPLVRESAAAFGGPFGPDGESFDAAVERLDELARGYELGDWPALVHLTSHALMDGGRAVHAAGGGAPHDTGTVEAVFASSGGVPKLPIPEAKVGLRGVAGDRQAARQHHGKVWQALCLWSADVVDGLRAEGHPIAPGHAGENISVRGVDWAALHVGSRVEVGDVLCELSAYATPCKKNAAWFADRDFNRMNHDREPGISRVYASVLRDGIVRPGDPVVVEP
jgi:MOSC domain-containing protein YiiM